MRRRGPPGLASAFSRARRCRRRPHEVPLGPRGPLLAPAAHAAPAPGLTLASGHPGPPDTTSPPGLLPRTPRCLPNSCRSASNTSSAPKPQRGAYKASLVPRTLCGTLQRLPGGLPSTPASVRSPFTTPAPRLILLWPPRPPGPPPILPSRQPPPPGGPSHALEPTPAPSSGSPRGTCRTGFRLSCSSVLLWGSRA